METILGGPVLASIVTHAPVGDGGNMQPLAQPASGARASSSSPAMLLLFDAPLAPLYFAAVFLIHPDLGFIALAAGVAADRHRLLNQRATSAPLGQAGAHASKADAQAEALARNSQVINAMGMLNESILHWGREQASALDQADGGARPQLLDQRRRRKFFRLVTQIAILGWRRLPGARRPAHRRHDDRRLDHRRRARCSRWKA